MDTESRDQENDGNCFLAGTFAAEAEINVQEVADNFAQSAIEPNLNPLDRNSADDDQRQHSMISFGGGANNMQNSDNNLKMPQKEGHERQGSCVSIRDIQEVRDKVPASPATKLNEPIDYFQ